MKKFRKQERNGELTPDKECFFILGHCWEFIHDKEYPFQSEAERAGLWQKFKRELQEKMYLPRDTFEEFCSPDPNRLRPAEWWLRDSPEPRRILNGAKEVKPGLYDYQPLEETDYDFLSRLNLLSESDLRYIETPEFKESEARDLSYREYWFSHH